MNIEKIISIFIIALLSIWITWILLYKLQSQPLARWDEMTNYAVVTKNINSHNPLVLTLHILPFFEKPPLWYYLTSIIARVYGPSNMTIRTISVLSAITTIILIYYISAMNTSSWTGVVAVILFTTIPHVFIMNAGGFFSTHTLRSADADSLQIMLIMSAVYCFLKSKRYKSLLYIGAAFSALAFLTKGPLGLLPYGIYIFIKHSSSKDIEVQDLIKSSLTIVGLISIWMIPMLTIYKTDFVRHFIMYHLFSRFTTSIEGHNQHILYPIYTLTTLQVFPFFIPLVLSYIYQIYNKNIFRDRIILFSNLSIITILLINMSTQTKLAWYLLPLYPFASIFIARTVYIIFSKRFSVFYFLPIICGVCIGGYFIISGLSNILPNL